MPQKLRCRVTEILDHGERVYSLFLEPESPAPRFRPGQFLHLALDQYIPGDFWPDSRPFSIASSPTERQCLRITYAVKGQFTGRMEAELQPGGEVWVKMPYGEFIVNSGEDVCLLAGGTGVTAFTAFLAGLPADNPYRVYLYYGARHPDLLIYRSLVEAASTSCPSLQPVFLVEESSSPGCLTSRLEAEIIWQTLPAPLSVTYYLSGPPGMLKVLSTDLVAHGVPAAQVCMDAWE